MKIQNYLRSTNNNRSLRLASTTQKKHFNSSANKEIRPEIVTLVTQKLERGGHTVSLGDIGITTEEFAAAWNQLKFTDKVFGKLDLSNNEITKLPEDFFAKLEDLQQIDLSHNKLQELPSNIEALERLKVLNASNNQIKVIPAEIGGLQNLQGLYLSGNKIQVIPPEIGGLQNLETLHLYRNEIVNIPQEINQMRRVINLRIDFNPLGEEDSTSKHT